MSTHETKLTPKNYITTGINRNLLTPCRRVGLSRSKKTPKHANASPLTQTPNSMVKTIPVKKVENCPNIQQNTNVNETPNKIPTPKKTTRNADKIVVETKNEAFSSEKGNECPNANIKLETNSILKETVSQEKSTLVESPIQNVPIKTLVIAQVHCPAKRNINFNEIVKLPGSFKRSKEHMVEKSTTILDQKETPLETVEIKNKKRRLRLDSDDFLACNENRVENETALKIEVNSKNEVIKKRHTILNGSSNGIVLNRFTTEDYLREYSSNPEIFQENLEKDADALDTFLNTTKSNQIQSRVKKISVSPNQSNKNNVAIVCSSTDNSFDNKPKYHLSTKKSSLELKEPSKNISTSSESRLKKKLSVSLERLTKESSKSTSKNDKSEDIELEELPSTPKSFSSKTSHSKLNFYDDDDDELFTSSPENDMKQRENLLKLILNIENEIKLKEEKLEKLKQAQVYKKKHSPEKLKVSSDRWLEGCRAGLDNLLIKMQEHGPMEMDALIKKLRIPDDIVEKLKL